MTLDRKPTVIQLAKDPVDHDSLVRAMTTEETGSVVIFSGMVRGATRLDEAGDMRDTLRLEYEAFEPMALAKMRQLADEIRQRWPAVVGVTVIQRVGILEVGQNTILIACSAPGVEDGAFEAASYGIDRLKEIVPVWKKEVGPGGTEWVEGGYMPGPTDRAD